MSIIGFSSNPDEKIGNPIRKRNVSGELDVFEATRYFSDFNEPTEIEPRTHTQKQSIITEQRQNRVHPETEEENIIKPPMSPGGGKLASFLNSLLCSAGFRRSKSTPDGEAPGGRWRRRSCDVTNSWSTLGGGGAWRENAPRRSFDDKHVIHSYAGMKSTIRRKSEGCVLVEEPRLNRWVSGGCETQKQSERLLSVKRVKGKNGNTENGDVDNGCESDSSSDLFELNLCGKKRPHQEPSINL